MLRAIAYADGTRIVCSSLGRTLDGLDLGPPDFVSLQGMRVWPDVALPAAPELRYIALSFNGYTIFLNRGDYVNAMTLLEPSATIGLFYPGETNRFFGIGYVKPEWLQSAATRQAVVGELSGTVLAILPSSRFQHVAVVAIPPEAYLHDFAGTRWAVAAAGGIAGVMLCGVILWRKRWARDMPQLLRRAIRDREFYLVYQPIVDIRTKQWIGAEALLRWKRPYGAEPMGPDIFIPAAERCGLSEEIAALVFDLVAEDLPVIESHVRGFYVSLNISANEVKSGSGRALTERLLRETGLPPSWINIELTERGCSRKTPGNHRWHSRPGSESRDRRLRHGLFQPGLPGGVSGGLPEARQGLHARAHRKRRQAHGGDADHRAGQVPRYRSDRGRRGNRGTRQRGGRARRFKVQGWYFERALSLDKLLDALPVKGGRVLHEDEQDVDEAQARQHTAG